MKRYLLAILFIFFSTHSWAEGAAVDLVLSKAPIDQSDINSIKRGATFFAANCMACHTLIYMRYDKVAQDAGITYDKMPVNIKTWPFGVTPPDLSLEANIRGVDWIYTYLHSFYQDPSRPTGVNNLLVPNTAMPDIVGPYQGDQVLEPNPDTGAIYNEAHWYDMVTQVKEGSMTPEQFDGTIADVVNFLAYASEPYRAEQEHIGWWVLGFLCILLVLMYFLKREYWKDVKRKH